MNETNVNWELVLALLKMVDERRMTYQLAVEMLKSDVTIETLEQAIADRIEANKAARAAELAKRPSRKYDFGAYTNNFFVQDETERYRQQEQAYNEARTMSATQWERERQQHIADHTIRDIELGNHPVYDRPPTALNESSLEQALTYFREGRNIAGYPLVDRYRVPYGNGPVTPPIDPLNGQVNADVQIRQQANRDTLPASVRGSSTRIRQ